MKIYLCLSDTSKKKCVSVTIVDSAEHCRELLRYLSFFSFKLRSYEHKGKKDGTTALKVFAVVPDISETMADIIVKRKEDKYGKVSNGVLGEV